MQPRIVTLPSAKIREVARVALEGYWKPIVLFMFFYYLITTGVSNILDIFFVSHQVIPLGETGETMEQQLYYGSSIYSLIISGPVSWALSKFMLDFFRYQKIEQGTLLEGFSRFISTFALMFIMGVKIFLWSLLFIVPGIIATFRYSQAFYVQVDHPEYTADQCLKESSRIMAGNKMKVFCLSLSFIGWNILAAIPAFCFASLLAQSSGIVYVLFDIVLSVPILFLNAYINVALTVFYELAIDNLSIVDESAEASDSYSEGNWDPSMYSAPAPEETLVHQLPSDIPEPEEETAAAHEEE